MKTPEGGPSGHFFLNKDGASDVAYEVLANNFGWTGGKAKQFHTSHFDATWDHFDVNKDRLVEVERMPQFLRYFLGDSLNIGLQ